MQAISRRRFLTIALALGGTGVAGAAGVAGVFALTDTPPPPEADDHIWAHDTLPFYSYADLLPRWRESTARPLHAMALRDQFDQPLDERTFDHGPTIVSFFFSQCATVCPASMDLLANLQRKMAVRDERAAPHFLSISVTPLTDTPPVLAAFAAKFALPPRWRLATGRAEDVKKFARDQLFTDIDARGPGNEPLHTERAFLIDAQRRVRGLYDVTRAVELQRLWGDVQRLPGQARSA